MAELTQNDKPMRLETPLGGDTLVIERLECIESVSAPFQLTLDLQSLDAAIDPQKLLRKPVTVTVALAGGGERYFHGLVRRFAQLGRSSAAVSYRAEVVPALWFLSLGTDCRIFQQKKVPEIVKAVLKDAGVTDVRDALTSQYPAREYCVQYRESHLDFIARLMEEEGIFYFFEHTKDKHTLVLADAASAVKAGAVAKLRMEAGVAGMIGDEDAIIELSIDTEVRSAGKVTLVDYNDTTAKRLEGSADGSNAARATQVNQFDYPGKFQAVSDGERLARIRIEESESLIQVVSGRTACRGLGSGQKLDISDHYRRDINASYHVFSVQHRGDQGAYVAGARGGFEYETSFRAIPHAVPFRPRRTTPKSIVHGSQTAVVVGPSGEEIYVDKYGRVKVQFYWDQLGKSDDKSSCWVRVSSTWAGKQWGFIQLPRIGQEVIVDFLEGDPDRPLIVGRVYNGEQLPPYELPANGTQSGVKTRSSKGGAAADANEIRFEDKKGSEQLLVHAQKDFAVEVENDETHSVGNDRTKTIENNETTTVKGTRTETVEKDETITVKGKRTETVEGDETITLKGKESVTLTGDRAVTIKEGKDALTVSSGNLTTEVSQGNAEIKLGQGNFTLKTSVGSITHDAMQGIELKVGQNSIKIDQSGVTIKGLKLSLEGTTMTEVKGLMTTVQASAIMTVKGAMTMIN